jgi:uncharacterized protein
MVSNRRGLADAILESIKHSPVTIIEGGRAVGKSTLCRSLALEQGWSPPLDLSDPEVLSQIRIDPLRFLRDLRTPAILDEAQLEPSLTLRIKRIVDDRNGRPGQFILTGSARLGRTQLGGSDPLAGRAARFRMWPMTEGEIQGKPCALAASIFKRSPFVPGDTISTHDTDRWLRGGLPGLPGVLTAARPDTFERAVASYVESVVPLGAASARIDHARLTKAFRYLAANPAQLLNVSRMASELSIKADTASSYLEQLEASFLLFRAEAHRPSEHKVLTAHPRVFASDVGLASWAMRLHAKPPDPLQRGSLLENRVALAFASTVDWTSDRIEVRHWRDQRAKVEVDLLLIHPDNRAVALEVKASMSTGPDDAKGLVAFALANRDAFKAGYILYTGDRVIDLTPKSPPLPLPRRSILAVPLEMALRL